MLSLALSFQSCSVEDDLNESITQGRTVSIAPAKVNEQQNPGQLSPPLQVELLDSLPQKKHPVLKLEHGDVHNPLLRPKPPIK